MAAIAGIVSSNGKSPETGSREIGEILEQMRHRGPDNTIVRSLPDGRGALGANEINLTPERTSCTAVSKPPFILFDGELFNERADGQNDVELFEEYYLKYGKDCFKYLDGGFSCVIVDEKETILARDPVGARPLFYGAENGSLCFSTEMKGLRDYVRFDVNELPPGHLYSTREGTKPFEPYAPAIPEIGSLTETAQTVRDLVIEAVRKRVEGVGGVSLSGGLDSSIVAVIAKEFNPNLKLFTGAIKKAPGPDLEHAKFMADFLGLEHHIYLITDEDIMDFIPEAVWYLESFDEDCISGIISNYFVSKLAKSSN